MTLRYVFWASLLLLLCAAVPANAGEAKASAGAAAKAKSAQQKTSTAGKASATRSASAGKGTASAKKSSGAKPSSATPAKPPAALSAAKGAKSSATSAKPAQPGSVAGAAPGTSKKAPGTGAPPPTPGAKNADKDKAATYTVRLRDLESKVDELKEQIRRSHTRLSLLSDTILSGGLGGARAEIVFRNELSNAFRIIGVTFVLDGSVQYTKEDDTGALSNRKEIPIFSGPVPPGDHTMQVIVNLRGHGYGVFSYLKAYKPTVKRTHSFTIEEGKRARIEVIAWEKGSVTTPIEERPALRFVQKMLDPSEPAETGVE